MGGRGTVSAWRFMGTGMVVVIVVNRRLISTASTVMIVGGVVAGPASKRISLTESFQTGLLSHRFARPQNFADSDREPKPGPTSRPPTCHSLEARFTTNQVRTPQDGSAELLLIPGPRWGTPVEPV